MSKKPERPFQVRDDNLRLIFAEVEGELLRERLADIKSGALLLIIYMLAVTCGFFLSSAMAGPNTLLTGAFLMLIWIGGGVVLLSPIIFIGLYVEHRRAKRALREHHHLLKKYGRL